MKIKIHGAGPTGSILALALARENVDVSLYDPLQLDQLLGRSRAYALTHSSRRLLQYLDLWLPLQQYLYPFKYLSIQDIELSREIIFDYNDLTNSNCKEEVIGWILDHNSLMNILIDRISNNNNIDFYPQSIPDSSLDSHDLLVAADVVELAPQLDPSNISSVLAAKVARSLLMLLSVDQKSTN